MSNEVRKFYGQDARGVLCVRAEDYDALEYSRNRWIQHHADAMSERDDASIERDALRTQLEAIRAAGGEVVEVCDGKEQEAFEEFAKGQKMDMAVHPMHWLFLNKETYAARQGWKAAIRYCAAQHSRIVAAMAAELAEVRHVQVEVINSRNAHQWECERLAAELEAARKQEPDSDAELDTRMKAAGMMSVAELLAGAPLDAFTRHDAVNDLQSLLQWAEMRRAECLKAQARYDLGERDKSDDLYEWTVAHCAVFTELHVNIRAALAGLPPLAGQVSKPEAWTVTCGDWRDTTLAIHGEKSGHIASGIPEGAAHAIAKAHNAVVGADGALLATPSMEVKS